MSEASAPKVVLAGLLGGAELDAEMEWSWRTRLRREADGMPFVKVGGKKFYPIQEIRTWLMSQIRHPEPPRGPGRPRKHAA